MFVSAIRGPYAKPYTGQMPGRQQRRGCGLTISVNSEALNMSFSPSIAGLSGPLAALSELLTNPTESAFARLGSTFLTRLPAPPLSAPYLVGFSAATAALLGLAPG